jgi:hypothetical protein
VDNNLTITGGTLDANAKNINIAGNWANNDTFTSNSNTVTFDGSGTSIISGNSTFYNFTCATAGKTLTFTRGTEQKVTHNLTLTGSSGNRLILNDTGAGSVPKLSLGPSPNQQSITNVSVTNNDASGGVTLVAQGDSALSGTTTNWVLRSSGTTFTWTGTVSSDWNTPGNWDIGLVPSSTDTVIIPSGTPNSPAFAGPVSLATLTINSDGALSTSGYALTVTGNFLLNGTLNAGSSVLTIDGNVTTTSAGGSLRGASPWLSAGGHIGSFHNPLDIAVTGTITIYAAQMQDEVSVAIKGSSKCSWNNSIPGLIFANSNILDHFGQQALRPALETQTSILYQPRIGLTAGWGGAPLFMGAPAMAPMAMPLPTVALPVVTPVPAPAIAPAALPAPPVVPPAPLPPPPPPAPPALAKPSFEGAVAQTMLPQKIEIASVAFGTGVMAKVPSFAGVISRTLLPAPLSRPSFAGIAPSSVLLRIISPEEFRGIIPQARLLAPIFAGADFSAALPKAVMPEDFSDAYALKQLPPAISAESFIDISARAMALKAASFRGVVSYALLPPVIKQEGFRPGADYFSGAAAVSELPSPQVFTGVTAKGISSVLKPQEFAGAEAETKLSSAVVFNGIIPGARLPQQIPQASFAGALPGLALTEPIEPQAFLGAAAAARLPGLVSRETFASAVARKNLPLPVNPALFQEVTGIGRIKVMFPGGQRIMPTFGLGIPLGAEKPVMEPRIREEKE